MLLGKKYSYNGELRTIRSIASVAVGTGTVTTKTNKLKQYIQDGMSLETAIHKLAGGG